MEILTLFVIFGCLLMMLASGLSIAFCFLGINVVGFFILFGPVGLEQLVDSIYSTLNTFILLPVPLFILMGEVLFQSKIGPVLIHVIAKWMGRVPGRLGLLAVAAGTLFSTLTGTSLASVAMLGTVLVPEMKKHGYHPVMSAGPILGSGGLAMMIPPSGLAVLAAAIGEVSVGRTLIAIIVPGLLLAASYAAYIIIRCAMNPSLAPAYDVEPVPLAEKLRETIKYVLPQGIVIFLVIGIIFLGVATPSEAAATGAAGTIILALCYRRFTWDVIKRVSLGSVSLTGMLFLIICGATAFSQILAYTGGSRMLTELASNLPIAPILVIIAMQVLVLILGALMDVVSIMMITLPIFMPVVEILRFDTVWFLVLFLINIEMAGISPPYGMSLFVLKGVVGSEMSMADIYRASFPFLGCGLFVMALVLVFPLLALWLPRLMS
jgi:tripartite ATP-independent transporter DctM subunit